jgi:hypothetical protein
MSRRKSNISQLRCAGWKKSLEFVRHRGKTLQLTLMAWVTASMANLGCRCFGAWATSSFAARLRR